MSSSFRTISLPMPFQARSVNCYLIEAMGGFILIDSGLAPQRASLEEALEKGGCHPGDLKLIVLTHGDFDHTGNAAYLRQKYGGKIAMHPGDATQTAHGDIFGGRSHTRGNPLIRWLAPRLIGYGKAEHFSPDHLIEDGDKLDEYGLEACVLHLPGHSEGSIGVLTAEGDLFCGDLLNNFTKPQLTTLIDDEKAARSSLERLRGLDLRWVFPGHGPAFALHMVED